MKPERAQVFAQGMVAGLVGYLTVVILFAVVNLIEGRSPFYTAALLGGSLFYGIRDPAETLVWPGAVLSYNGVHLLVFLVLGVIAAWLAYLAERGPEFWYIGAVVFIFMVAHMYGFFLMLTDSVRSVLPPWLILGTGLAACLGMGAYLLAVHPKLRAEFRHYPEEDVG